MTKLILFLKIPFVLISCGGSSGPKPLNIDPEFIPAYERFVVETSKRNIPLPDKRINIKWGKLEETSGGKCYFLESFVRVNDTYKDRPQSHLDLIVLHELGHCLLGMDHRRDKNSIMSTIGFNQDVIDNPWNYLDDYYRERYLFKWPSEAPELHK